MGHPRFVLEKSVVEDEPARRLANSLRFDPHADPWAKRALVGGLLGEEKHTALVLTCQTEQAALPSFLAAWRKSFAEVDDDETECARTQQDLGRFAQVEGGSFGDGGNMHDDQGVEIDAALREIGRKQSPAFRLDPCRGLTRALGFAKQSYGSRRPSSRDLALASRRQLDQPTRGNTGSQRYHRRFSASGA